jgi:hypothetical protein
MLLTRKMSSRQHQHLTQGSQQATESTLPGSTQPAMSGSQLLSRQLWNCSLVGLVSQDSTNGMWTKLRDLGALSVCRDNIAQGVLLALGPLNK